MNVSDEEKPISSNLSAGVGAPPIVSAHFSLLNELEPAIAASDGDLIWKIVFCPGRKSTALVDCSIYDLIVSTSPELSTLRAEPLVSPILLLFARRT